jgi:hypothetical protein
VVDDPVHRVSGRQGVMLVSRNGDIVFADVVGRFNLARQHVGLWVYIDNVSSLAELTLYFTLSGDWSRYFVYSYPVGRLLSGWNHLLISRASFAEYGDVSPWDWPKIVKVRVRVVSKPNTTVRVTFDHMVGITDMYGGMVTIMLDGAWESVYTRAYRVMSMYGMPGVVSVITSYVGEEGYMTLGQLSRLQEAGWDVISHAAGHRDLTKLPLGQV